MNRSKSLVIGLTLGRLSLTVFAQQGASGLSPEEVQRIEETLSELGYNVGSADGDWDQQTEQAVREFQQAQGLEPSGSADEPTRAALGMVEIADSADEPPPAQEFE